MDLHLRLLSELRAVLHARDRTTDPAVLLVLSAAQAYLQEELRKLGDVTTPTTQDSRVPRI